MHLILLCWECDRPVSVGNAPKSLLEDTSASVRSAVWERFRERDTQESSGICSVIRRSETTGSDASFTSDCYQLCDCVCSPFTAQISGVTNWNWNVCQLRLNANEPRLMQTGLLLLFIFPLAEPWPHRDDLSRDFWIRSNVFSTWKHLQRASNLNSLMPRGKIRSFISHIVLFFCLNF